MGIMSFDGRIGRGGWWLWSIVLSVSSWFVSGLLIEAYNIRFEVSGDSIYWNGDTLSGSSWLVIILIGLAYSWAWFALYARRWHDRGKSAWWSLISVIPLIGGIWMLIELGFLPGTPGPNQYG